MILIVTYDLKSPKDYHDFYEALKSQADQGKWWHYLSSTWLLSTNKSPQQVVDALKSGNYLDPQDLLFVCELTANYQGWLPKPAWEWINKELPVVSPFAALLGGFGKTTSGLADLVPPRTEPFPDASPTSPFYPDTPVKKPWEK